MRALSALRRHWLWLTVGALSALLAGCCLLAAAGLPAARWLLLAAAAAAWQLFVLYRDLPLNKPKAGRLLPHWGAGTWLSSLRLVSLSLLAGFLVMPRLQDALAWLPFGLALLFNLSDLFDGYLARRSGVTTALGSKLDMDLDGRGMLVACLLLVHYGLAAWPFALAGLARYVYLAALWFHRRRGARLRPLPPNALRRPFAGVQMGVATGALAPLFAPPATLLITTLTLLPFLGHFIYDWLVVIGKLNLTTGVWVQFRKTHTLRKVVEWAALLLRGLVVALLLRGVLEPGLVSPFAVADLAAGLCLLFGLAGRPVAMLALILTTARLYDAPLTPPDAALLAGLLALMYLGMGRWQLWQPEHSLLTRRLGDRRRA